MNSVLFSKYRTELMGVATLLIILCHAPANSVVMPSLLARLIGSLGFGVDMFLFLSGIGVWYSMRAVNAGKISVLRWYEKRFIRILLPCAFFTIPLIIIRGGEFDILRSLIRILGFEYLLYGIGLWYVSCALLLYLLSPLLEHLFLSYRKWQVLACLIVFSIIISQIMIIYEPQIHSWRFVISRFPSFFVGYAIASIVCEEKKISLFWLIIFPIIILCVFYILNHKTDYQFSLFWLQGIPAVTIIAYIIDKLRNKTIHKILTFFGIISLESYVTNVLVLPHFKTWDWKFGDVNINPGNWTYYIVGTVLCIFLCIIVNKLSKLIIKSIL